MAKNPSSNPNSCIYHVQCCRPTRLLSLISKRRQSQKHTPTTTIKITKNKDLLLYIVKLHQPEIAKMNPHLANVMSFQNRNGADKREQL